MIYVLTELNILWIKMTMYTFNDVHVLSNVLKKDVEYCMVMKTMNSSFYECIMIMGTNEEIRIRY